jgi:hypothetical protein
VTSALNANFTSSMKESTYTEYLIARTRHAHTTRESADASDVSVCVWSDEVPIHTLEEPITLVEEEDKEVDEGVNATAEAKVCVYV